jgi:hypothetical protein
LPEAHLLDGKAMDPVFCTGVANLLTRLNSMNESTESAHDKSVSERDQWTVILDFPSVFGSPATQKKLDQLVAMDEETTGKAVTIIGQTINLDANGHLFLRRFEFANGKLSSLGDFAAKDMGSDLEGLLKMSREKHPHSKTALIIDSHGLGQAGLVGDQGRLSLPKLELAISNGLGKKVDVLDLDSCEMAQEGSLRQLQKSTKHLIASAEFEQGEGQNLTKTLDTILEDPSIDASMLANEIIQGSREYALSGGFGIHTLAHFDLKFFSGFEKTLNTLGSALTVAMKNERNAQGVRKVIDQIPAFDEENNFEKRDLKLFATKLNEGIQKGEISDETGQLAKAIKEVLAAQGKLVRAYYGDNEGDLPYDKMGGLSVFLPSGRLGDTKQLAESSYESNVCRQFYALAQYPDQFAPYKKERDAALCMTAAPVMDPATPKSELVRDQKRFSRAMDKFVEEQSDARSGAWANFIHGLLR